MRKLIKILVFIMFVIGTMYMGIEVIHHGSSHWSMGLVASICSLIGYFIHWKFPYWSMRKKSFWIANVITVFELIAGLIWNQNFTIWDYRSMVLFDIPLHFKGQICIPFWLIWFFLTPLMIWLIDKLKDEKMDLFKYYKELVTRK